MATGGLDPKILTGTHVPANAAEPTYQMLTHIFPATDLKLCDLRGKTGHETGMIGQEMIGAGVKIGTTAEMDIETIVEIETYIEIARDLIMMKGAELLEREVEVGAQ